ncbi:hypothetical protein PLESTB_000732700 [Pleodorina starrii]|uniref:RING-type domain-containing protein n=1 Tax=Pleodorina starrii TaxID=330485 RepID=A0A9W6BJL4_9CHLO|nr:hypothetical protein PLESTM_000191200 [Pleodorina starrii]GLC53329.1 hypothetical protein PLESTB_000732700 [Pleodorina starrii]GLC67201.1 hypothetical protein PLESTF_000528500 [Pleodorina starrii]
MGNACCAPQVFLSLHINDDIVYIVRRLRERPELLCVPRPAALLGLNDSALHMAAESRSLDAMQQIFGFLVGADPETLQAALRPYCRRKHLQPPDSFAAAARMAANMRNNKGQTPLMYAAYSDCPEQVKLLLEQGADPWAGDNCGYRNALHYAAMAGSPACVEALMKHIMPHMLVRQGVRYINSRSLSGLTPLHYCVFYGHETALAQLLLYEPNINAASTGESYDTYGSYDIYSTPLHFAALQDSTPMSRLLLLHYARRRRLGTLLDPRLRVNSAGKLPSQVARSQSLAALLHPAAPLGEVLGREGEEALLGLGGGDAAALGPPTLAALAAAALRQKLLAAVEVIEREWVEEEALQRQQTGGPMGRLLSCSTPRRAVPDCSSGARDFFRAASRGLTNRGSFRRARSGRRHVAAGAVMPTSPRLAPTLDRQPHPLDFAVDAAAAGGSDAPPLGHRSRGAPSPTLGTRGSGGGRGANGRANGNGNGNCRGSRALSGRARGSSPPPPPLHQQQQQVMAVSGSTAGFLGASGGGVGGGSNGSRASGGGGGGTGASDSWHPGPASPNGGGSMYPLFGGGSGMGADGGGLMYGTVLQPVLNAASSCGGALDSRAASRTAGPYPVATTAAANAAASSEAGCDVLAPTLPGGASPTTPYFLSRPLPDAPSAEFVPAGGSPTRGVGSAARLGIPRGGSADGLSEDAFRYAPPYFGNFLSPAASLAAPPCGGGEGGNLLSPAASLFAGSCVDFDAAAAAAAAAAVTQESGGGGEGVYGSGNGNGDVNGDSGVLGVSGGSDDDDGICSVCFARPEAVMSPTCRHGLCTACAGEMCRALVCKPLLCPFCRRPVGSFVRMVRPPAAAAAAVRRR